jgi:hypothetical protein
MHRALSMEQARPGRPILSIAYWLISGVLIGWGARVAWQSRRRPATPEELEIEADLAPLGARMARARFLSEWILSRSNNTSVRAVAERWLAALAAGGPWNGLVPASASAHITGETWPGLEGEAFERRAIHEMRAWLESAQACCDVLLAAASPDLRERARTAAAEVETSLRHLDAIPPGDDADAFQRPVEG